MVRSHFDTTCKCLVQFNLAVGGSKIHEAYLIYQDLSEKYPMTGLIRKGKAAVCCMHHFYEVDTMTRRLWPILVVCSLHMGKPSPPISEWKGPHDYGLVVRSLHIANLVEGYVSIL